MREIKFRAWDVRDKYMAYPGDCVGIDPKANTDLMYCDMETVAVGLDGQLYLIDECGNWEYPENRNLNKELILMQYTGLKDKNGKEGFEEDILDTPIGLAVIKFGEYSNPSDKGFNLGFYIEFVDKDDALVFRKEIGYWLPKSKIIGNVYENPELLEAVK